jgi:hypothetical protein
MLQQKISTQGFDNVTSDESLSKALKNIDTGFFYNSINIDTVK